MLAAALRTSRIVTGAGQRRTRQRARKLPPNSGSARTCWPSPETAQPRSGEAVRATTEQGGYRGGGIVPHKQSSTIHPTVVAGIGLNGAWCRSGRTVRGMNDWQRLGEGGTAHLAGIKRGGRLSRDARRHRSPAPIGGANRDGQPGPGCYRVTPSGHLDVSEV